MNVPTHTEVLVIGGGPGGSYAAAALAREGIEAVVLEADLFPRYHIGESMIASVRHFLRIIGLDEKFDNYGFTRKVGAAFKLNDFKREGYTDFLARGPQNYAWNFIRSESDELMFRYAGECGAKIFDGIKVTDLISQTGDIVSTRPTSAHWKSKSGSFGIITFDYLIDASGRAGILSTKYLKTRTFNQELKNVATWGYWTGCSVYGAGTPRNNSPFFEALQAALLLALVAIDESGWAWMIPLHNGTTSVGIVMNQEISNKKKANHPSGRSPSMQEHYLEQLKFAPSILALVGPGELVKDATTGSVVKSASDYSYSASSYAGDHYRIVGDAGAFIDPFFSSGVHLALAGALSAALSICAARRGDCTEEEAAVWHSSRVSTSFSRFLVVVLAAYKQMRAQAQPILASADEPDFDRAFEQFRPVIQGSADVDHSTSARHASEAGSGCARPIEFCEQSDTTRPGGDSTAPKGPMWKTRTEDTFHIDHFATGVINGFCPRLERGSLGLTPVD
ncbi:hypothetical protein BOTBODRAFT_137937 [Botryobasidium botryosum FD-172 SS1]|uniref:FAD-binding domain-containing protein n=1 Tax=Botryobasidium botryosum (strain FD-172 SS1) TaxID=930990 RepID=A0A067MBR4_BOTB1|nr:hypothetical protein BOTBODRAFT_137937 [Botryobasidium botryosum FD-172 SS1]